MANSLKIVISSTTEQTIPSYYYTSSKQAIVLSLFQNVRHILIHKDGPLTDIYTVDIWFVIEIHSIFQ